MESDIVDRLRNAPWTTADDCNAAADEIERLRAERDEVRRAACKDEAIIRLKRNRVHRDSEEVLRMAKEISVERGWDCFKEDGKPCQ